MSKWKGGIEYNPDVVIARVPKLRGGYIEKKFYYSERINRAYLKDQAREWQLEIGTEVWGKHWKHVKKLGHLDGVVIRRSIRANIWLEREYRVTRDGRVIVDRYYTTHYFTPRKYTIRVPIGPQTSTALQETIIQGLEEKYERGITKYAEHNKTIEKRSVTKEVADTMRAMGGSIASDAQFRMQFRHDL